MTSSGGSAEVPRTPLPIDAHLPAIVAALHRARRLVVTAPPGSGKTTRLPPALLDAGVGDGEIVVLEPRRIAARAAARRVAAERGCALGGEVGYQVRGDVRVSAATRIRFVTEGVLVRRLCADPFLPGVAAVVLDEFHERHVETDLALSMLAEVAETVREELVIVVTSATLDPAPVQRFLGDCPHRAVPGRAYPVRVEHDAAGAGRRDGPPLAERVASGVRRALDAVGSGDVLVFLPGVREIDAAAAALRGLVAQHAALQVLPLHGSLPAAEQDRALRPAGDGRRRVVLATNVAESSLTIEGVRAVVDSGLARVLHHDPGRGIDQLRVTRIARAAADQRAGRAGRVAPGYCLRLWSAAEERGMPAHDVPAIRREDLAGPALLVRAFAGRDPVRFGWFEAPESAALERADLLLRRLGAIDAAGRVTDGGRRMLELPLHPRLARAMTAAASGPADSRDAVALACALLSERDPLLADARAGVPIDLELRLADLRRAAAARFDVTRCRALGLAAGGVRQVFATRDRLLGRRRSAASAAAEPPGDALARALLAGFPDRVAVRTAADTARLVGGRGVRWRRAALHHAGPFLLALDVADTAASAGERSAATRSDLRLALGLSRTLLEPGLIEDTAAELDPRGSVVAVRRTRWLDLVVDERRGGGAPDHTLVVELLAAALRRDPQAWLADQPALRAYLARLEFLRRAEPAAPVPEFDAVRLAGLAAEACAPQRSLRALRNTAVLPALRQQVPPAVAARLERDVPERIALPSGRRARIDYETGDEPVLAVRLQELFGAQTTPRILGGRWPLLLHLLAPNGRAVQVTRDLDGFWDRLYPEVRQEMRRRYPKHAWPEDPRSAVAEARPRRRRERG